MGQKTHPTGFRIGIIQPWVSTWFAKVKIMANSLQKMQKSENLLRKNFIQQVFLRF